MLKRIHHAAIICSDYPRSKAFYTEILGLRVLAENYRAARDSYKLDLALPDGSQIELFSFLKHLNGQVFRRRKGCAIWRLWSMMWQK